MTQAGLSADPQHDGRRRNSVVVTGAANGIGKAIVERLASTGWAVVGIDRDVDALQEVAGQVGGAAVPGDIRDQEVLIKARHAAEQAGRLSAWVNNAGIVRLARSTSCQPRSSTRHSTSTCGRWSSALGRRSPLSWPTAGREHRQHLISPRPGSFPGYGAYDAAKGGVEALTRYVCTEYGHLGIRCNAIAPGAVNTNIVPPATSVDPEAAPSVLPGADLSPMHRVSEPTEIAEVVAFLVEGPSFAINGHTLAVDNGMSARNYAVPPDGSVAFATPQPGEGTHDDLAPPLRHQ